MKSKVATIVVVLVVWIVVGSLTSSKLEGLGEGSIGVTGDAKTGVEKFCQLASQSYASAATRVRSKQLKNTDDLKKFFDKAGEEADKEAFSPLGVRVAKATGDKWNEEKIAAEFDRISKEFHK
jgi:hypothetical protein